MKKREINVSEEDGDKMLAEAQKASEEHYLILAYGLKAGLRRSEIVGEDDPRDGHWPETAFLNVAKDKVRRQREAILDAINSQGYLEERRDGFDKPWVWNREHGQIILWNDRANMLTGLRIEDFDWKRGGVWLRGKKQDRERFHPIPRSILERTQRYIGSRDKGRLFECSTSLVWVLVDRYARAAGLPHVWPHRLRHSAITTYYRKTQDQVKTQRFGRHKNFATTTGYIASSTPEEMVEDLQKVFQ